MSSNSALFRGGGAFYATLNNCTLVSNYAGEAGGGANESTLNNCTLSGNSASVRGGGFASSDFGRLNNCIAYFNTAPSGPNYSESSSPISYSCTTPLPSNGVGNITNAPLFVDLAGGDLRLQADSPCINAGVNSSAPGTTDLEGSPRIVSGTVDIGACEFQGSGSAISYAWLQQYGLLTDSSVDATDPDGDGHTTWQEWRCRTDPTNASSVLRLLSASSDGTDVVVNWQSIAGVSYFLERSTSLRATPAFSLLATNLPGQPGTTSFRDNNDSGRDLLFYRVSAAAP